MRVRCSQAFRLLSLLLLSMANDFLQRTLMFQIIFYSDEGHT